jgi:hypothetical protein
MPETPTPTAEQTDLCNFPRDGGRILCRLERAGDRRKLLLAYELADGRLTSKLHLDAHELPRLRLALDRAEAALAGRATPSRRY